MHPNNRQCFDFWYYKTLLFHKYAYESKKKLLEEKFPGQSVFDPEMFLIFKCVIFSFEPFTNYSKFINLHFITIGNKCLLPHNFINTNNSQTFLSLPDY